jgi:hypothetical protein
MLAAVVCAAALCVTPAQAQTSIGTGVEFLGYSFDEGLGADAAQLMLVPAAVRVPVLPSLTIDLYGAWARGRVEREGTQLDLSGFVDTEIKASLQATPWALVTIGATLPTGNPTHTAEEAVVASILATDLLGFREATWGAGSAITSSVATAARIGELGVGVAGAYAMRGEFQPSADADSVRYTPGSEMRVRVGLDRNFGNSTFTAGATLIRYAEDEANGVNLFQAGNRLRFDASYAFRASGGVWTLYAADLIRSSGDLTLQLVDSGGAAAGDSTMVTAEQNLFVAGMVGTVAVGGGFVIRPHIDFKLQNRTEADGTSDGSGWIVAAGGDIPLRIFGSSEIFPKARVLIGSIEGPDGTSVGLLGMEIKGTVRWSF